MKKIPVIIDCDPGHDDMVALVMAHGSGMLDIKAVTTVAGNNTVDNTTRNARNILHHIGADDVPLAKGLQNPMVRGRAERLAEVARSRAKMSGAQLSTPKTQGAAVHGATGMDGYNFPENNPKQLEPIHAVEMMAKILRESDEKITIISTGPLTNVAFLIRCFPDLVDKIEQISMMGGTADFVLIWPFMEYNTFLDPEATKIVFESGVPITMYGYDVTYRVLYSEDTIAQLKALGNNAGDMCAALLKYFMDAHNGAIGTRLGLNGVAPVHDACAVAGVIDPTLVTEYKMQRMEVETSGVYFDGATIPVPEGMSKLPANVKVVYNMDTPRFLDLLLKTAAACK